MNGPILNGERYLAIQEWCIARLARGRDPMTLEWINLHDAISLDIPMNTLRSIFTLVYNRVVVANTSHFRRELENGELPECVLNGSSTLFEYAERHSFSPYKYAKLYLGEAQRQKVDVSRFLSHGCQQIDDERLRHDLIRCFTEDYLFCANNEICKSIAGEEHERLLMSKLESIHACFSTEQEMRQQGEAKTPDILLHIPMAVKRSLAATQEQDGSTSSDEVIIVHWMDSKALFADDEEHAKYVNEQLKGYVSRFGSGLVIYWHGCTENVWHGHDDIGSSGIATATSFPSEWYFPTGEKAVVGKAPAFDALLPVLNTYSG